MKTLLILTVLAHGADAGTSLRAFSYGAHEANPLIVSTQPVPFTIQATVGATLETWGLKTLHRTHPKWATGLAWVSIGVRGSIAARNWQVGTSQRRFQ